MSGELSLAGSILLDTSQGEEAARKRGADESNDAFGRIVDQMAHTKPDDKAK